MKKFFKVFVAIVIVIFFVLFVTEFLSFSVLGECHYISHKTEEKYLRNLNKFEAKGGDWLYVSYIYQDSLATIHGSRGILSKYYISDVGLIPAWYKLSHAIDSITRKWINLKK